MRAVSLMELTPVIAAFVKANAKVPQAFSPTPLNEGLSKLVITRGLMKAHFEDLKLTVHIPESERTSEEEYAAQVSLLAAQLGRTFMAQSLVPTFQQALADAGLVFEYRHGRYYINRLAQGFGEVDHASYGFF